MIFINLVDEKEERCIFSFSAQVYTNRIFYFLFFIEKQKIETRTRCQRTSGDKCEAAQEMKRIEK